MIIMRFGVYGCDAQRPSLGDPLRLFVAALECATIESCCSVTATSTISLDRPDSSPIPLDRGLVLQPASIDVRLDRLFVSSIIFHYSVIDPAADQSDLTRRIDVGPDRRTSHRPGGGLSWVATCTS